MSEHVFTHKNGRAEAPDLTPSAAYGSFAGALASPDRGMIYIPTMDSRAEIDSFSRMELTGRVSLLYNNTGIVKGMINNIARMVCGTGLMPEPLTRDKSWNEKVKALWLRRAESPGVFSLNRKFSSSSGQRALKRAQLKDGDAAMVAARDEDNRLRFALYEGRQIGSGTGGNSAMHDGVLLDQHDGALSYRLLGRARDGRATQVDVPAEHVRFFCKYERLPQVRGVTCLAHAVNKLVDISETNAAYTKVIKDVAQKAYLIEQESTTEAVKKHVPIGPTARPSVVVEDPATGVPIRLEKLLRSGEVETLKPGQKFKILADERPHPNVIAFQSGLIRDIAMGTGYPFEVLWNVESMGGANTRFILGSAQAQIEEDQEEMVEQVLAPAYLMLVQEWEGQGELEPCEDPDWWMHEWLTPARLSVDFGKDGKIYIDQWHRGHITLKSLYGYRGENWQRQTDQWLDEIAYRKAGMLERGLTKEDLPPIPGAANGTPAKEVLGSDPDDDE